MKDVSFEYGEVLYRPVVEGRPATSETTGNVTIKNVAVEGRPAHFEVTHRISATSEQDGLTIRNSVIWTNLVLSSGPDTQYHQVEDEAAHRIPDALRALAEQIEKAIAETDARRAEDSKQPAS